MPTIDDFRSVWFVDFEFTAPAGERPRPLCLAARELRTGREVRHWLADGAPSTPPYGTGRDSLFVAYYASAELGCHLALNWPMPARILDLYAEFRNLTAGLAVPCGYSLLGARAYHGLSALDAANKDAMRQLAMRGGPYTDAERAALLSYCATDVDALAGLFRVMLPKIDLPRALLRARFMHATAKMEWAGVPIDVQALTVLRNNWDTLKGKVTAAVNDRYHVYVPVRSRTLNPATPFGSAVLEAAAANRLDADDLADAVDVVWQQERAEYERTRHALRDARQVTGLTARRVGLWEDAGRDHASRPGLDVMARELAGWHPELGIGEGYSTDAPDEDDHAGRLWDRFRKPAAPAPRRHDPDILRQAVDLVVAAGPRTTPAGPLRFSAARWAAWLARHGIPWPTLESGALALDDETFREMVRRHPAAVGPVRELRYTRSQLKLNDLAVGSDGRNRCLLSAFSSKTGRNQPSNAKFIFGPSTWLRCLIRPGPDRGLAYADFEQQEFGIAAALSKDKNMMDAYESGDPYLAFARQAGAVPHHATKESHRAVREQFKVCALGVQYGMTGDGLARRLNVASCRGRDLLRLHQETYPDYWAWSDATQDRAILTGQLRTVFGWTLHVGPKVNPRSLRNFLMQANGAEMLRLACCLATERGITVCAPVHDALLVEGPADGIDAVVEATQQAMREASECVLPGFPLRTDAKVVCYPDRYVDERGRGFWDLVWGLLDDGKPMATDGTGVAPPGAQPSCLSSSVLSLGSSSRQEIPL
jgi:hypothetical protein